MDFGTSRSSVAVIRSGEVEVLCDGRGNREIPSLVGVLENGSVVLGDDAQRLRAREPDAVVASPKRMLGRHYDDPEIQSFLSGLAVRHSKGRGGEVLIHIRQHTFSTAQLCAPIIYMLRTRAEKHLQREVSSAVLTMPVGFDDVRMGVLRQAARMAGLQQVEFVEEPTAAARAHSFSRLYRRPVAVYDFGGGTFDFSLVEPVTAEMPVIATAADTWLGGDDIDDAVAGAAADAFWRLHKIELRHQVVQWQRLLIAAERAKRELSVRERSTIEVREAALSGAGPLDLRIDISRADLERLVQPVIQRSIDTCEEAMSLADVPTSELDAIFLSGGTSHVPAVRHAVARFFGQPGRISVPPERAVVIGAAMHHALMYDERVVIV